MRYTVRVMVRDKGPAEVEVEASGPLAAETEAEEVAAHRRPQLAVVEVLGPGRPIAPSARRIRAAA
jgi:hypothetical protein